MNTLLSSTIETENAQEQISIMVKLELGLKLGLQLGSGYFAIDGNLPLESILL